MIKKLETSIQTLSDQHFSAMLAEAEKRRIRKRIEKKLIRKKRVPDRELGVVASNREAEKKLERERTYARSQMEAERLKGFKQRRRKELSEEQKQRLKQCPIWTKELASIGMAHTQGFRNKMEDRAAWFSLEIRKKEKLVPAWVFALFDGHATVHAANFCQQYLKKYLQKSFDRLCIDGELYEIFNALKIGFVLTDAQLQRWTAQKLKDPQHPTGCTAVIALIEEENIWLANTGDSRALLLHEEEREPLPLSYDMKGDDPRAVKPVIRRGGAVYRVPPSKTARVLGMLSLTRAFGNQHLRKEGEKVVTARPKITRIAKEELRSPEKAHLLLACDGLFDVAASREAAECFHSLNKKGKSPKKIAKQLVLSAFGGNSKDNISTLIVALGEFLRPHSSEGRGESPEAHSPQNAP